MCQAGFKNDREVSDGQETWVDDDNNESSGTVPESSGTIHEDDGSEELEGEAKTLGHSSKSFRPSSLRDWSEDDDAEQEPPTALEATALHVAAATAARGRAYPVVALPDSLMQQLATSEKVMPKKPEGGAIASKRKAQPAQEEPVKKQKKPEPAAKADLPPKGGRKVIKRKATEVDE
jgi:hypothetical protein